MASEFSSALGETAESTKRVCATSADVIKASGKPAAKTAAIGAKASVFAHSFYSSLFGGVIVGVVAYYLADKYLFKKVNTADPESLTS